MIKSLNGIKFLLFLFIFGSHFKLLITDSDIGKQFYHFFALGRFGVLCFFLLSGFCIALGYSEKFKNISKDFYFKFIKKRFIRIYPLYFLSGLAGLLFVQGINYLKPFICFYLPMLGPWTGVNDVGNSVAWFSSAIFFCYLVTPMVLFWFNKKENLKFHITFSLANYLILTIFSIYLMTIDETTNISLYSFLYCFPVIRLFEYFIALDLGFLFVKIFKNKLNFKFLDNYFLKSLIDILYIGLFLIIMYVLPSNALNRHLFAIPVICSFIVYLCIEKRSLLFDIFSSKLFNRGGNISYECFLIHIIVIQVLADFSQKYLSSLHGLILLYIMLLTLTIIIAAAYKFAVKFTEQKIREMTN